MATSRWRSRRSCGPAEGGRECEKQWGRGRRVRHLGPHLQKEGVHGGGIRGGKVAHAARAVRVVRVHRLECYGAPADTTRSTRAGGPGVPAPPVETRSWTSCGNGATRGRRSGARAARDLAGGHVHPRVVVLAGRHVARKGRGSRNLLDGRHAECVGERKGDSSAGRVGYQHAGARGHPVVIRCGGRGGRLVVLPAVAADARN